MAGTVRIERFPEEVHLSEIYQDVAMKFALVSPPRDGNRQCHQLVQCRDFLHDAVSAYLNKGSVCIYSFYYKYGKNPPVDIRRMRMLVKKPDSDSSEKFAKEIALAKKIINHYEEMAGWTKTKAFLVDGEPDFRFLRGPSQWMKAPHMISLYSLLIRLAVRDIQFSNDEELQKEYEKLANEGKGNDAQYLTTCRRYINPLITHFSDLVSKKTIENYYAPDTSALHNRGGIVSICSGGTRHFDETLRRRFSKVCKNIK